jgi:hypothetical protein
MIASAVTIEETTGQQRKLILRGAGLPQQGASWKTEQRLVTKWYAGNAWEATQHVLGPIDPPSEWRGVWNTTRLISAPPSWFAGSGGGEQQVSVASDLREVFDGDLGLVRSGALLRVTWATDDGRSIARVGRIGAFEAQHVRMDDLTWTCSFVWVGRGGGPPRATQFAQPNVASSQMAAVRALNNLASAVPGSLGPYTSVVGVPGSAVSLQLGVWETVAPGVTLTLFAAAATATDLSARISAAWSYANGSSAGQPTSGASAFDLSADGTQAAVAAAVAAGQLGYALGEMPVESLCAAGSSPGMVAAVAAYVASVHEAAQVAEAAAIDLAAAAKKRRTAQAQSTAAQDRARAGDVLATVLPKRGDTFASLAQRHLGSADLAGALARANGVPSYQVAPTQGSIVLIPVLSAADISAP